MSTSKYIRPMSFPETIATMYRLYLKFMFPILILNIIIVAMSWWVLVAGAFVGPVLMMASNTILGRPPKVWESFRKGIFSVAFLKVAFVSISYIVFIFIVFLLIGSTGVVGDIAEISIGAPLLVYSYLFFSPLWIFIPMIMLIEKKGLRASVKRSFQILRNDFARIIQMDIFITAFLLIVAYALTPLMGGTRDDFGVSSLIGIFLPLITGFSSLPYVFVYYEYRARQENYNEELLTQEMGYQPIEEMMTV